MFIKFKTPDGVGNHGLVFTNTKNISHVHYYNGRNTVIMNTGKVYEIDAETSDMIVEKLKKDLEL